MAKMRYNKILEVSEDPDRVYFSIYINNNNQRIIGVPKASCDNKAIYAGTNFNSLVIVDSNNAKLLLTELMKRAIQTHPAINLCDRKTLGPILEFGLDD